MHYLFGLALLTALAAPVAADPLSLILPTSNHAVLRGDGPSFYQYTDRYFDGVRSRPWQGGQYGFVRNARRTSEGLVYTRFHEGVDIQAVYRDRNQEPLDTVRVVDDGYVVYVNDNERHSSYGRYVVVEHWWSGAPFYSLYAHLNRVDVTEGTRVTQGDRLGRLGYTGPGINRRRAHLHFEINMLLNRNFGEWYARNYRSRNHHDVFNGINLAGIDVAQLYLALQADPSLTIEAFLSRQTPFYTVTVPLQDVPDLIDRYDFLLDWSKLRMAQEAHRSWEISFSQTGVPVRIRPSNLAVEEPSVTDVRAAPFSYAYVTNGRVTGSSDRYHLSSSGLRHVSLLTVPGDRQDVVEFERVQIRTVSEEDLRLRSW